MWRDSLALVAVTEVLAFCKLCWADVECQRCLRDELTHYPSRMVGLVGLCSWVYLMQLWFGFVWGLDFSSQVVFSVTQGYFVLC